jgi:dTDP-4-dehydrorhamnose reductase
MSDLESKKTLISAKISDLLEEYYRGQKLWSAATHGSTIVVVVASAVAALLAQSKTSWFGHSGADIATLLSLAVAIISTVQSRIGFERKWIANRMTRSALSQLDIDAKLGANPDDLAKTLKDILAKHDQSITTT